MSGGRSIALVSRTRGVLATLVFAVAVAIAATPAHALAAGEEILSPATVVERGRELDGTEVLVSGEALGETLHAGTGHRWVNVTQDGTGVGLWIENDLAERIEFFGKHGVRGDTVTARGVVNVACEQHAGEFDIHVSEIVALETGEHVPEPIGWWKLGVGLAGILVGYAEYRLYVRRRERLHS